MQSLTHSKLAWLHLEPFRGCIRELCWVRQRRSQGSRALELRCRDRRPRPVPLRRRAPQVGWGGPEAGRSGPGGEWAGRSSGGRGRGLGARPRGVTESRFPRATTPERPLPRAGNRPRPLALPQWRVKRGLPRRSVETPGTRRGSQGLRCGVPGASSGKLCGFERPLLGPPGGTRRRLNSPLTRSLWRLCGAIVL